MKLKNFAANAVMMALVGASMSVSAAAGHTATPYPTPGLTSTQLWGINDQGVLAGGNDNGGFIDDHGAITAVNLPGSAGVSFVTGISNSGLAVGSDGSSSFFYQNGTFTAFDVAGSDYTLIRGISPNGRYVAGIFDAADGRSDGFVWDTAASTLSVLVAPGDGQVSALQGVNDSGFAVGSFSGNGGGVLFDATTGTSSTLQAAGDLHFLHFRAIDNAGDLGGWGLDTDGHLVGFVGTLAGGFDAFQVGDDATYLYALNNLGEGVGFSAAADGSTQGFTLTPSAVPEPGALASMSLALLVLGGRLVRRRRTGA